MPKAPLLKQCFCRRRAFKCDAINSIKEWKFFLATVVLQNQLNIFCSDGALKLLAVEKACLKIKGKG